MRIYKISTEVSKSRAKALMQEIDMLYADGQDEAALSLEEELDPILEQLDAEDEDLEPDIIELDYQDEDEAQGGMQDQLIKSYHEYINNLSPFDGNATEDKFEILISIIWDTILKAGAGKGLVARFNGKQSYHDLSVGEKNQLVEIAKDAYYNRIQLIKRRKK